MLLLQRLGLFLFSVLGAFLLFVPRRIHEALYFLWFREHSEFSEDARLTLGMTILFLSFVWFVLSFELLLIRTHHHRCEELSFSPKAAGDPSEGGGATSDGSDPRPSGHFAGDPSKMEVEVKGRLSARMDE